MVGLKKYYLFKGELYPASITLDQVSNTTLEVRAVKGIVLVDNCRGFSISGVEYLDLTSGVFDLHSGKLLGELEEVTEVYIKES